jgi:hypothetical protein
MHFSNYFPYHPTSEYHDTKHHPEYVIVHGGSPCVLCTTHSAFHLDKADKILVRPDVQGQTCHILVVVRCVLLLTCRTGFVEFRYYYQTNHKKDYFKFLIPSKTKLSDVVNDPIIVSFASFSIDCPHHNSAISSCCKRTKSFKCD